jgi:vacuolar-type H+-ATPase subunit H
MKTRPKCPNCGQEAFGTVCKWCGSPLKTLTPFEQVERREPEKYENPQPVFQAVDRRPPLPDETPPVEKNEEKPDSTIVLLTDARQRSAPTVREIAAKAQSEADARTSRILAASRQKAEQIVRDAERQVASILEKARAEAGARAAALINEAKNKSAEIIEAAEQTARELVSQETVVKEAASVAARLLADARDKADFIISEAELKAKKIIEKAENESGVKRTVPGQKKKSF